MEIQDRLELELNNTMTTQLIFSNDTLSRAAVTGRIATVFTLLFLFVAGSAFAQGQRQRMTPEQQQERFEKETKKMITALELTDEQTPMFMEIMEASQADRNDMMEDMRGGGGDRSAMQEKMQKLNASTNEALAGVLTADQMAKYKKILTERAGQRRGRGPANS